ncbi:MAG TPA: PASTA domain-containing protein [Gemmatimonadales bacterium]|nr:PASTA domain-containing protein [Gemmatimonadales bacterium]
MKFRRHGKPVRDDAEGAHVSAPDQVGAPEPERRGIARRGVALANAPAAESPSRRAARPLRDIFIIVLIGLVGFLVAWMVLAPVSIWQDEGTVPRVVGMGLTEARTELTTQGYRVTVADGDAHISAPRGEVYWQDPPPGTTAPPGTSVTITASTGLLQVPTPDVVGLDQVQAERVIIASGLKVGARDSVTDRTEVGGVVLGTRPSAGMARSVGASVDLIVNGAAR